VTVGDWLDQRTPAVPEALRQRVAFQLGDARGAPASNVSDACAEAGVRVVESLISTKCSQRQNAIDLLAADALVTYAIESAAERSKDFAAEMDRLVARVAAVAGDES
jgi:hypothetical protein